MNSVGKLLERLLLCVCHATRRVSWMTCRANLSQPQHTGQSLTIPWQIVKWKAHIVYFKTINYIKSIAEASIISAETYSKECKLQLLKLCSMLDFVISEHCTHIVGNTCSFFKIIEENIATTTGCWTCSVFLYKYLPSVTRGRQRNISTPTKRQVQRAQALLVYLI